MIYLEKIHIPDSRCSGLIDIFACSGEPPGPWSRNTTAVFNNAITKKLSQQDIYLGTQFGSSGVTIEQLFQHPDIFPNTIFEISITDLSGLSVLWRKFLTSKFTLLVQDLNEGGWLIEESGLDVSKHLILTGSMPSRSEHQTGIAHIPVFLCFTLAEFIRTGNLQPLNFTNTPEKLVLVPVHKPRPNRLEFLELLDQANLLQQSDWSLTVRLESGGELGHFTDSPNVGVDRWNDLSDDPFIKRHLSELPKLLDNITRFSECLPLDRKFHRKYKWYVGLETYTNLMFVTEKTIKGFLAGMPVLTVAPAGFNKLLEELGFIMPGDYDHLSGSERSRAIIDIIKTDDSDYTAAAEHNYKLMTDVEFLAGMCVDRITALLVNRDN